jgi:serpin B
MKELGFIDTIDVDKPDIESKRINDFVAAHTNNLIKGLIPPKSINSDLLMIFLNTIYFKSNWKAKFDKANTIKDHKFNSVGTKSVDMMVKYAIDCKYYEDKTCQVVELPYENSTCVMGFVLPTKDTSMEIKSDALVHYSSNMDTTEITKLCIPKFKLEQEIDLKKSMMAMGYNSMFEDAKVDDMLKDIKKTMHVDEVKQKAVIIVDEEGTEAAAATYMTMIAECCSMPATEINFIADRPFTFYIKDNALGVYLFFGSFC